MKKIIWASIILGFLCCSFQFQNLKNQQICIGAGQAHAEFLPMNNGPGNDCGPVAWNEDDLGELSFSVSDSSLNERSTYTQLSWTVGPFEDRTIFAGIRSFPDTGDAEGWAASRSDNYARHNWTSVGSHNGADIYYRETTNGNQYLVAGLYRGYHYVVIQTNQVPFGSTPVLWDVPLARHTEIYDALLGIINSKCTQEDNNLQISFELEGRPLRHLVVHDRQGTKTTDTQGMVEVDGNSDEVVVDLTYYDDKTMYFINKTPDSSEPFKIRLTISEGRIQAIAVHLTDSEEVAVDVVNPELADFSLVDYKDQLLDALFYNYMFFQDALEFYEGLGVDFSLPVHIVLGGNKSFYLDHQIFIDLSESDPSNVRYRQKHSWAPYVHYHEFSHFAMHTMYGAAFDIMTTEKNHGGYANPTTMDSWMEGFAGFMAVVIANEVGRYWAERPSEKNPALYPMCGSLDADYRAWQKEGKAEEFAMAGVLWDLIDQDGMNPDHFFAADLAYSFLFKGADVNEDGVLTKEEFALSQLRNSGDTAYWKDMVKYGFLLADAYDVSADMDIFETYKGDNDSLNREELYHMSEIAVYPGEFSNHEYDVIQEWLDLYDVDENDRISASEAEELLRGHEIVKIISNGQPYIEINEMTELSKDPKIQDAIWGRMNLKDGRDQLNLDEKMDSLIEEYDVNSDDDDNFHMEFSDLWDIMKLRHMDFTSFGKSLAISLPDNEHIELFRLLMHHGMFFDPTEGNKRYDKDVEAFIDLNNDGIRQENETFIDYPNAWLADFWGNEESDVGTPSNYERPERRSTPEFPGHYVKGAEEVHYVVWERGKLRDVYSIQTKNGYVPVPPGAEVYAVNGDEMHHFSSTEFERNYSEIKSRGYIAEFGSAENEGDTDDGGGGGSSGGCFLESMQ